MTDVDRDDVPAAPHGDAPKPWEETWSVVGCGNPEHGSTWECFKVKNERDEVLLRGVDKATADRFAAIPLLVRALGNAGALKPDDDQWHLIGCDGLRGLIECIRECQDARAALKAARWTP